MPRRASEEGQTGKSGRGAPGRDRTREDLARKDPVQREERRVAQDVDDVVELPDQDRAQEIVGERVGERLATGPILEQARDQTAEPFDVTDLGGDADAAGDRLDVCVFARSEDRQGTDRGRDRPTRAEGVFDARARHPVPVRIARIRVEAERDDLVERAIGVDGDRLAPKARERAVDGEEGLFAV